MFTKISELYQVAKCSNTSILYTLKAFLSKNRFHFFFLIFCHAKIRPSFRMPSYWHLFFTYRFFKCLAFSKVTTPSQKSDKNNSIRIIIVIIVLFNSIIKINIIKIYNKNTHFITTKCNITRFSINKE